MCHFSYENDLNLNGIYIIGYEMWFIQYSHKYMYVNAQFQIQVNL